jgi:hypothetical protein
MTGLTHLNLSNNPLLSDSGGVGPKENLPASETLGINSPASNSATDSGLCRSGLKLLNRLVSLDLSSTGIAERTLKEGIAAPDLRHLRLNQCRRVEDSGLYQMAVHHPRLERLELRSCVLTDTGLVSSLSCLPRLVFLDLGSCGCVTSSGDKTWTSSGY